RDRVAVTHAQVIVNPNVETFGDKVAHGMTADIAGAAGDEDTHVVGQFSFGRRPLDAEQGAKVCSITNQLVIPLVIPMNTSSRSISSSLSSVSLRLLRTNVSAI